MHKVAACPRCSTICRIVVCGITNVVIAHEDCGCGLSMAEVDGMAAAGAPVMWARQPILSRGEGV